MVRCTPKSAQILLSECMFYFLIRVHVWELHKYTQCDLFASNSDTTTASLEETVWFPHDGFFGEVFAAFRYKLLNMHLWNKWILRCTTLVISHILGSYEWVFFYELTQFRSTFQTPTWERGRHLEVFLQNQQIFIWNFPQKAPRKLSQHEQMLISPGKCPCPSTEKRSLNLHC